MANYLYNDVELPEIPNWDKTVYPYAIVKTSNLFSRLYCYLYLLKDYQYRDKDANNRYLDFTTDLYYFVSYPPDEPATEWGSINKEEVTISEHIGNIKWANFDILNADGSVKLAASDPVPVGGATPEYAIIPTADYKAACDAIRAKTGKTALIKSGDMASEIASVPTGGGGASSELPADLRVVEMDLSDGKFHIPEDIITDLMTNNVTYQIVMSSIQRTFVYDWTTSSGEVRTNTVNAKNIIFSGTLSSYYITRRSVSLDLGATDIEGLMFWRAYVATLVSYATTSKVTNMNFAPGADAYHNQIYCPLKDDFGVTDLTNVKVAFYNRTLNE